MKRSFSILPGFRLASGITLFYLSLLVLIPLCALVWKTTELSLEDLLATLTNSRVLASFRVSILTALAAAFINLFLGFVIAWVLVRYP
ncbi:MAG TPA: sulfate ABC transporter permease subunit CysT, partial [Marinobacter sp.]|nr:sulfate ABC transporter permease subunit CysT [Marinobacter sp.]